MKYIKCFKINKKYKSKVVLEDFSFIFTNKNINFLQGINGTGKTTLILCILEFLHYEGIISHNLEKFVFQPEKVVFPDYLSVDKYLSIILKYHHQTDIYKNELVEKFNMKENLKKDIINLSKGMRQKVLIIQTLMIDSDCYIFDEPLNGLDPTSQDNFMKEIDKLFKNKKLVIIVTHFPEHYSFNDKLIVDLNKKENYVTITS